MQETSLIAYANLLENLGERQMDVYKVIHRMGPISNTEISDYLHLPINCITGRTNELVKKEMVMEAKKDLCPITNKLVIFWKVLKRID